MTSTRQCVQVLSAAASLAGLLLAPCAAAQAQPDATPVTGSAKQRATLVYVLRVAGSEQLFARLLAELRAQGFDAAGEVVDISSGGPGLVEGETRRWLEASGTDGAAVALESTPIVVRIWVVNPKTGKQVFREAQREPHTDLDNAIVALWAVELLRATGIAAAETERPQPAPAAPAPTSNRKAVATAQRTKPERRAAPSWSVQLGPAIEASPGGISPALALAVGARLRALRHFGVEASMFVPIALTRFSRGQNEALVSVALASAGPYLTVPALDGRARADLGLGLALAVISASGVSSEAPFATAADRAVAAGPYARAGADITLVKNVALRADVFAGAAFPRPLLLFGENRVAHWGSPWLAARLALEVGF